MSYQLYHGDCLDILPTLAPQSVDVCITDPPYGVKKAEWDDEFPITWIRDAERIAPRLLVMVGPTPMIQAGQELSNYQDCVILYNKNGMTRSRIGFGNYIAVLASGDWRWEARPNLLAFSVSTKEKINHPSPKPLAAMMKLLEKYTKPGWTVLDPFMGSGTTGVACGNLGRSFIGIERNLEYFNEAQDRIASAYEPLRAMQVAV